MENSELITRARAAAVEALKDQTRYDGTPFIGHPDAVARIVADEIGLPEDGIAAIYLHEASRMAGYEVKESEWGSAVCTLVDGLNKISTIKPKDTRLEAENYKKLIIQYSADPRVTVLKLADRLEVMRNLKMFPKSSREQKILETLMLYIPLAHQLGLYNMKREMENIYLAYAQPEEYRLITNKLKAGERDREKLMAEFIEPLERKLSGAGIRYKLKMRTKAAYSIWQKMVKQKVPFEGVYDVFAIRFIIDCDPENHKLEKDLCWQVYSFVTEEYEADTGRLRDWISTPKPNGYESLHITVKNRDGAFALSAWTTWPRTALPATGATRESSGKRRWTPGSGACVTPWSIRVPTIPKTCPSPLPRRFSCSRLPESSGFCRPGPRCWTSPSASIPTSAPTAWGPR